MNSMSEKSNGVAVKPAMHNDTAVPLINGISSENGSQKSSHSTAKIAHQSGNGKAGIYRSSSSSHIPSDRILDSLRTTDCIKVSTSLHNFPVNTKHIVKLEEFAPSSVSVNQLEPDWMMSLHKFTILRHGNQNDDVKLPRQVRRYYRRQDELIDAFEGIRFDVDDDLENTEEKQIQRKRSILLSKLSFALNLILLIGKAIAAYLSGSLAIISSVIDSGVDLVSGILMWWSSRAMKNRNPYNYPQGRTKLEPVSIIIISVVMSLASVQMIRESIEKIIEYAVEHTSGPIMQIITVVICALTVVTKLILFLLCRRVRTSSAQALALDHRNDTLSNTIAIICGYIGYRVWSFADPIGAIVISLYIIFSWFATGYDQIKMLTGHTARPDFLKKITWIALNHHPKVLLIDTVRAFHFGNNFLVEVDIVLPEEMNLRESHDIGESLQLKIERLDEVERAFVHLDYECEHDPQSEHKVV